MPKNNPPTSSAPSLKQLSVEESWRAKHEPSEDATGTTEAPAWKLPQVPQPQSQASKAQRVVTPGDQNWRNQFSAAPIGSAMDAPTLVRPALKGPKPGKYSANFPSDNRGTLANGAMPQLDLWLSWHLLPTGEVLMKTATSRPGDLELRQVELRKLKDLEALSVELTLRLSALRAQQAGQQ